MQKNKWYNVLAIILLCVIFSPFILFVLIAWFFQSVLPAPFEYKKYKKSKYYEVYKKKYKIGITHDEYYLLQSKLLENDIYLEEIKKPYGYMCLLNDDFCFVLFDITDLKLIDDEFQIKLRENRPYISIDEFIEDAKKHFGEECRNRKLVIFSLREDENEFFDILSNEKNKLSLQSKGINFYIGNEDLAKTVKQYLANKE